MPLLQPAQAQKHVTVNEALARLDGLVNLVLQSVSSAQPPASFTDGQCWGVSGNGAGAWAGRGGQIAIASNGGWVFLTPTPGMQAFVADMGVAAIHDESGWVAGAMTLGALGSALTAGMAEAEVTVAAGGTFDTGVTIPSGAMVIGAAARVTQALSGSLSGWRLGTAGAENRFGQGIGIAKDSWARGMLGTPMTYYQPAALLMTAEGGTFSAGTVSLAVHWLSMRLPG
ncbi:DUF2793 domain-containing protein [Paracoccus sp. EGI L200073]|nr:DUF2793 domain-containing protein [Paracoccus salsus]